jgi:flagellar hook-associated protein 2
MTGTTGTITSLGVGSGLDLATLLDSLTTAAQAPLTNLQNQQTSYQTKLSAYGQLSSAIGGLQSAAATLSAPSLFQSVSAASSNTSVLSASGSATALAGSYAINVTQLAQSQSLVSAGQADATTAIGVGTVTIDFGTISGGTLDPATGKYSGSTFNADATRAAVPITIAAGSNSLQGIRDAINAANAGVTASIVSDGSATPQRLVLTSTQSGQASSMRISVTGDAALQSLLGNDPAGTQNLQQTVAAQDANLTVNGIAVTSPSNTVKEAIQGTTLSLASLGSSSVNISANTSLVSSTISAFVQAYNNLQSTEGSLTAYNATTKTGGPLLGDSTLNSIQNSIRGVLNKPQAGGPNDLKVLSQIGITLQLDGTLSIDSTKLNAALTSNLAGVSKLFASPDGSTAGYGKQLSTLLTNATATGGTLQVATDGINTTLKQLAAQYTAQSSLIDAQVAQYRTEFQNLDTTMNTMNNTMTYLTQQFNAMNNVSSSSSSK